jgi:putative ABC transport system ATP-binding protein
MKVAPPSALEARSLHRFYRAGFEEPQASQWVSLAVQRGEFVVVTGSSASGKSTPLAGLPGMANPHGGGAETPTARTGCAYLVHRDTCTSKPNR